jgi:hypothetical protein
MPSETIGRQVVRASRGAIHSRIHLASMLRRRPLTRNGGRGRNGERRHGPVCRGSGWAIEGCDSGCEPLAYPKVFGLPGYLFAQVDQACCDTSYRYFSCVSC